MTVRFNMELSKDEKLAIAALKKIAAKWPKSLWLFSASGNLKVMKKDSNGTRIELPPPGLGVDPAYIVADITGIENDGGDW